MASVTGDAAAGAREAPSLFLRNATGLVKGWSSFDAFVYAFMSVNLVTLGMYYSFTVFGWVADGSPVAAILLTAIAMTFLCITYAGLIAVMPRAGGDYVWQTRVLDGPPGAIAGAVTLGVGGYLVGGALALGDLGAIVLGLAAGVVGLLLGLRRGGIGFVLSATGWWLILALWAPIYGAILNIEFVQPLAALAGLNGVAEFFATSNGVFAVSLIVIGLVTVLVALGMAGYARIQRLSLYIGLIAIGVMFLLMLISSQETFQAAFDREASALWGVSNAYQATIDAEAGFGYVLSDLDPLGFGGGTFLLIPFMLFYNLWPNWGATTWTTVRQAKKYCTGHEFTGGQTLLIQFRSKRSALSQDVAC